MNTFKTIFFLTVNSLLTTVHAQDLDRLEQKDFLRIGGNVGTSQVLYFNESITARRVPYTYVYQENSNNNSNAQVFNLMGIVAYD